MPTLSCSLPIGSAQTLHPFLGPSQTLFYFYKWKYLYHVGFFGWIWGWSTPPLLFSTVAPQPTHGEAWSCRLRQPLGTRWADGPWRQQPQTDQSVWCPQSGSGLPRHLRVPFNSESEPASLEESGRQKDKETEGQGEMKRGSCKAAVKSKAIPWLFILPLGSWWDGPVGSLLTMRIGSRWPCTQGCFVSLGSQDSSWSGRAASLVRELLLSPSNPVSRVGCGKSRPPCRSASCVLGVGGGGFASSGEAH